MNSSNKADKLSYRPVQLLKPELANLIAAGEVIERPASIVKELVENAIDAQSTHILVELEAGGKELIQVTDDGIGMTREDLCICVRRHATSKIYSQEELESIATLGFRGEALASIGAVSTLTITTRHRSEDHGWRLRVESGMELPVEAVGCPVGTRVSVEELFLNVPARRKFLKQDRTELSHSVQAVKLLAAGYPEISFELKSSGRTLFKTRNSTSSVRRLLPLFGEELADKLIEIRGRMNGVEMTGYISNPEDVRFNARAFYFFLNSRPIRSPLLWKALMDAYKGFIQRNSYPVGAVFLDVDPKLVDVNVHPTKQEVRFSSQEQFYRLIYNATKSGLENSCHTYPDRQASISEPHNNTHYDRTETPTPSIKTPRPRHSTPPVRLDIPFIDKETGPSEDTFKTNILPDISVDTFNRDILEPVKISQNDINLNILGQIDNTFIVCSAEDGIYLIDQHAAHEAILFTRIIQQVKSKVGLASQRLLMPKVMESSSEYIANLEDAESCLRDMGFEISPFGPSNIAIHAMPQMLSDIGSDIKSIRPLIEKVLENPNISKDSLLRDLAASMACHCAIRAGQRLSREEMTALIDEIMEEKVHHCPHGRPIMLKMTLREIYRAFKR